MNNTVDVKSKGGAIALAGEQALKANKDKETQKLTG